MTRLHRANLATAAVRGPVEVSPAAGEAIRRATGFFLSRQAPEGYWIAELEADTTLESDYILLQLWLYPPDADGVWRPPTRRKVEKAARYILSRQLPDGGWSIYPGGPPNVSGTVKAYVALKLAGVTPQDPCLEQARRQILQLGGVEAANSYTKIYLSYFGLYDRAKTPTVPPELFLLPDEARYGVYGMSSWTRCIIAPLAILSAKQVQRPVPRGFSIREIFSGVEQDRQDWFSWRGLFLRVDQGLKIWERLGGSRARNLAVRAAAAWMLRRLRNSDGLGAIFPAMMNSIMALTALGYRLGDTLLDREIAKFNSLVIEEAETLRLQPCLSPVWDTALACHAIGVSNPALGEELGRALQKAAGWLLTKEARRRGDWAVKRKEAPPGGWYFEFANEFYPDVDDTCEVLLALGHAPAGDPEAQSAAEARGVQWLLNMQSRDGGWAAFDVDNDAQLLNHVPFADHNAMLDVTCADITGRALDALAKRLGTDHPAIRAGAAYLKQRQEEDGSWFGRWGVNYIYGTCFALRGLASAGEDAREAYIIRAGEWLRSIQNADGGWGETCASYDDPSRKGQGESTASQTAWALMGLFAAGDTRSESVQGGVRYLLETQNADGSWTEEAYTGTGFPSVFYLRYHFYPVHFPLMALGEYRRLAAGAAS